MSIGGFYATLAQADPEQHHRLGVIHEWMLVPRTGRSHNKWRQARLRTAANGFRGLLHLHPQEFEN